MKLESNIKLVSLDLDGTLVGKDNIINDENINVLKKLKKRGTTLVVNTGRGISSAISLLEKFGICELFDYGVFYQGTIIYSFKDKSVIDEFTLDIDLAKKIISLVEIEKFCAVYYYNNCLYAHNNHEFLPLYETATNTKAEIAPIDGQTKDVLKVVIVGEREDLEEFSKTIPKEIDTYVNRFFSNKLLYEFVNIDCSKGVALKKLCSLINIDINDTLAVGDNGNDYDMIKTAGIGCTLENGIEEIKEIADYISPLTNDEGGVAQIINKFIL